MKRLVWSSYEDQKGSKRILSLFDFKYKIRVGPEVRIVDAESWELESLDSTCRRLDLAWNEDGGERFELTERSKCEDRCWGLKSIRFVFLSMILKLLTFEPFWSLSECGFSDSLNSLSVCLCYMAVKHLKCDSYVLWSLRTIKTGHASLLTMSLWLGLSFAFSSADTPSFNIQLRYYLW